MSSNSLVIGQEVFIVDDLKKCWESASTSAAEFIALPLFHPRNRRDAAICEGRAGPITRSDMDLDSDKWISHIIGCISSWIDVDNEDHGIRADSEYAFRQETNWAIYLGLQVLLLPMPSINRSVSPNFSRLLRELMKRIETSYQQIWIRIPLIWMDESFSDGDDPLLSSWQLWDNLYRMTGYHHKLSIALELGDRLPDNLDDMRRWIPEPVKAIILSTRLFELNTHGYPVLPVEYQNLIQKFFSAKLHVILSGKSKHDGSMAGYVEYLRYLKSKHDKSKELSFADKFTAGYRDTLQAPLQPLMDNLESSTYATFERDPVKYIQYQRAVTKALESIKGRSSDDRIITIFVVGAGRGPLVACSLAAGIAVNTKIRVYAVEKNENAVITLRNRKQSEKWENVSIISSDMRDWQSDVRADIIVSELLGSFGCNELSPECMDGVQRLLKADGVMIPSSYTSYIAPVSSPRLWMGARDMPSKVGLETPFVVKFHRCDVLTDALPVFTFTHPKLDAQSSNSR
jgi:type II protein arginine methyltransferase